jgi:DNA-binding IclR family transcriptional regulator
MGTNQREVLRLLRRSRQWNSIGPAWTWESVSRTRTILDTLVKRGLATKGADGTYRPTEPR